MDNRASNIGHIDFAAWLFRLFTWDGVLPTCMMFLPAVIEQLWPNRGAIETATVVLPIVFFFVRIVVGCRHIDANHCSPGFQRVQAWALVLGVFILVFLDAVMILSNVIPRGAVNLDDVVFVAIIVSIYLVPMAVAMYPGRSKPKPGVLSP
jgi:Gpi18-like mannosyltransferase